MNIHSTSVLIFEKLADVYLQNISMHRHKNSPTIDLGEGTQDQMERHQDPYIVKYYKLLDSADVQIAECFSQPGIHSVQ